MTLALIASIVQGGAALAALLTVPGTIELLLLTCGALLARRTTPRQTCIAPGRLPTIVPAHDEQSTIAACVTSLRAAYADAGIDPDGQVLVIADHCSDATAMRARAAGAAVLERRDGARGKGAALADGFAHALADPSVGAVAVVDADTMVEPSFVAALLRHFAAGADAVQARYEVRHPEASLATRLMRVELLAFNRVRPRGRARWGLSAGLLGNGFALGRATLAAVPWSAHSIVEDLEYHLRLVRGGRVVRFAEDTGVWALMPAGGRGARTQRARWEGGRLRIVRAATPALIGDLMRGQWRLAEPVLELLLLPLAYHVLLLVSALLAGTPVVRLYAAAGLIAVALHVLSAVRIGGGGWRDVAVLATAPLYIAWKVRLAPTIARAAREDAVWTRTERGGPA